MTAENPNAPSRTAYAVITRAGKTALRAIETIAAATIHAPCPICPEWNGRNTDAAPKAKAQITATTHPVETKTPMRAATSVHCGGTRTGDVVKIS
jgi:hypothetical protein